MRQSSSKAYSMRMNLPCPLQLFLLFLLHAYGGRLKQVRPKVILYMEGPWHWMWPCLIPWALLQVASSLAWLLPCELLTICAKLSWVLFKNFAQSATCLCFNMMLGTYLASPGIPLNCDHYAAAACSDAWLLMLTAPARGNVVSLLLWQPCLFGSCSFVSL